MNNQEIDLRYNDKREITKSTLLGFFIGLAVIVPGISGSTVAIMLKLYDKLIYAIGNIFNKFKISIIFLLPILLGAFIGLALGFISIKVLLEILPFAITTLFAGLMLGAFPAVSIEIKNEEKKLYRIILFIIGLAIPIIIGVTSSLLTSGSNSLENLQFYHYFIFIFLGYLVAITQIVPGLSATAIMMAFGYFKPIFEAISISYITENPQVLLVFLMLIIGFGIGIVSFSKILGLIFQNHRKTAFFLIVGLSLGSIFSMFFNPDTYQIYISWISGNVNYILDLVLGIILFIVGAIIAYLFVIYEQKKDQAN